MINTIPMATMLLMLVTTMLGSYLVLKPAMAGWEAPDEQGRERFAYFTNRWAKIFVGATAVGALVSSFAWLQTGNTAIGLVLGLVTALLGVAAWTDAHVYKVPYELSILTCLLSAGLFLVMLATGEGRAMMLDAGATQPFMPRVYFNLEGLYFFVITLGLALLGFFIAVKSRKESMLYVGAIFMFLGLFLFVYGMLTAVAAVPAIRESEYWTLFFNMLLVSYPFLGVAAGYDLFLPTNGIGGADTIIFWTYGFAFAIWVTSYNLFVALIVAFLLQLVLHLVAKPLGLGYEKEVRNSPIRQAFANSKAKRRGVEPATTHTAYPVPFIPMLAFGVIATILVMISVQVG